MDYDNEFKVRKDRNILVLVILLAVVLFAYWKVLQFEEAVNAENASIAAEATMESLETELVTE